MALAVPNAVLSEALDVLGQSSKRALLYQLRKGYNISIEKENLDSAISLERLQSALKDILGASGASMITKIVFAKLDSQTST